jgi:hypothetical protein
MHELGCRSGLVAIVFFSACSGGATIETGGPRDLGGPSASGGAGGPGEGTGGASSGSGGFTAGSGGSVATSDAAPEAAAMEVSGGDGDFGLAGPSRCGSAGVALCESFEDGLDATIWSSTKTGDGTVTVDELHAARGSKALHVRTANGGGHAFITERRSFPATSAMLYGRMFVWLEDDITTSGHFSIAEGKGTGTGAAIRFGGQFKSFGVGTDQGASGDWTDRDNKPVPSKTWMCLEFQFKGDSNEFHVWWDDVERPALHVGASRHGGFTMPAFTSLWFGWWMYNAQEPQDLWIDEIAIDSKPIGCTK